MASINDMSSFQCTLDSRADRLNGGAYRSVLKRGAGDELVETANEDTDRSSPLMAVI